MAEGVEIAVGIYYLVKPKSKPKYTMLDMDTDQRVECRTHFVVKASSASNKNGGGEDSDNAGEEEERDEPLSGDVKYALELGGETIVINKDEKELLRRLDEPGIFCPCLF